MNYAEARPLIKSGDPIFFRGTGLIAGVVRDWTDSPFSHVGMAWRAGERVLVLESRPAHRGITIDRPLSQALADGPTWVPTLARWTAAMEARAMRDLGFPYGWGNAIRGGLHLPLAYGALDCSEYVAFVHGLAGGATPKSLFTQFDRGPSYSLVR